MHCGVCVRVYTTARYAHLARDSVKDSAARIAASIGEDILGERGRNSSAKPWNRPACR